MIRRFITILFCLAISALVIYKLDAIVSLTTRLVASTPEVVIDKKNSYAKGESYELLQATDDYVPYNYQDLLNIFYMILDAGYETFTFYCPNEYLDCVDDVIKISDENNKNTLATIGNYVSPFNNFVNMRVLYDMAGEITVNINHVYTQEEIDKVNNEVDRLWKELITDDMSKEDIIYTFHDYIINHTRYDVNYEEEIKANKTPTYQSNKALGPLFEGYAICSGYTDLMAIILDRLDIKNYKVASETHVWNAVYLNDKWVHLDLTWGDPRDETGEVDTLLHKFYLIDTKTLEDFKIDNHNFDKSLYIELK